MDNGYGEVDETGEYVESESYLSDDYTDDDYSDGNYED